MLISIVESAALTLVALLATGVTGRDETPRVAPNFTGKIVAVAKDGKSITIESAPAGRGEPAQATDIKLTAATKTVFSNVGIGGAKLTPGYLVHSWTADGSKDTAGRLHVIGKESDRRGPDLAGPVTSVAAGKTISITLAPRGRDDAAPSVTIQLTDKTHVLYTNVGKDGAKPADGYRAEVWFKDATKDTAARVTFTGSAVTFKRDTPQIKADSAGKVAAIAKDGKTLTLALPGRERGDESVKVDIKLTDNTMLAFFQVGPNGARPTEGYAARVWLADGSKDTAAKVFFQGVPKETPMLRGKVIGIGKGGKSITVETPGKERGDPPIGVEVKFTPKTKVIFQNVSPEGALLTEGYVAQVTLVEGSTDTAAYVVLGPGPAAGERQRE